jgi:isoleucyl-tRNA synthetase
VNIKVRQPLNEIRIPAVSYEEKENLEAIKDIVLPEVNVKKLEIITDEKESMIIKRIKPNFKLLGPRFGKEMKQVTQAIVQFTQEEISEIEKNEHYTIEIEGTKHKIKLSEVEISTEDIPGWLVANEGQLTVALDVNVTTELKEEGVARELINRIQNMRKEKDFDVTDKITIQIVKHEAITDAIEHHKAYIRSQTLATNVELVDQLKDHKSAKTVELDEAVSTKIEIQKTKS